MYRPSSGALIASVGSGPGRSLGLISSRPDGEISRKAASSLRVDGLGCDLDDDSRPSFGGECEGIHVGDDVEPAADDVAERDRLGCLWRVIWFDFDRFRSIACQERPGVAHAERPDDSDVVMPGELRCRSPRRISGP